MTRVLIGSRESALAMWQANWVVGELRRHSPEVEFEIIGIKTEGDRVRDVPLAKIGGRGVFIKELESALGDGRIDLAVHSLKDVPSELPAEFALAAISEREDVRDVLVSRWGVSLDKLPTGSRVGTSSVRRAAQILHFRPDFQTIDLRGNVDTRLRKAATEDYDGVVLAAAGIKRLGLIDRITQYISTEICLPAVGQGALGVEIRAGDEPVAALVAKLNHRPTQLAVLAERACLRKMGSGCSIPVGAYGRIEDGELVIEGVAASPNGTRLIRARESGRPEDAEQIGERLAGHLFQMGALEILQEVDTKGI